jgi:hypothetical protein
MNELIAMGVEALADIAKEWAAANEADKAAIEARALTGIETMRGVRSSTADAHAKRTAASEARFEHEEETHG